MKIHHVDTAPIRGEWHWKEPHEERKKELQQYCYNQHWMKSGGLILWNAIAICEMSKTSFADWKTHHIPFGAMVEYHPISARDQSKFHQFGKKVLPGIILGYGGWEFGKETLLLRISRNWKRWTHQKFILGESMRKKYWYHKREKNSSSQ